jgi:hypothetical protein
MKKSASGQILVLVLLVVLIGMSIGLSIAARTLSNLKDTTSLNQSNRAFNAAEAGIELALSKLNNDPHACDTNCWSTSLSGVDSVNVTADPIGGNTNAFGLANVSRDDVIQVNLEGYTGSQMNIYWGKSADQGNCSSTAAIVVSVVYKQSSTYNLAKKALDKCAADASHNNNFDAASVSNASAADSITIQDGSVHTDYGFKTAINVAAGGGFIPSGAQILLARVRLMYGDSTEQIAISPVGANLPNQGQQITSTAVSGQNQRTVKVVRSNATLPAIFDYALFNGSTLPLTK